ncbi:MAG: hypothetical protein AAF682_18405 [Planctomycetota bacterium]
MHRILVLASCLFMFLGLASTTDAQLIINGTEVVDSSGGFTGNTPTLVEGENVNVTNNFPVSITLRVYDADGNVIGEVGVLAGDRYNGPHGLSAGTYQLCAGIAGTQQFFEIGEVSVKQKVSAEAPGREESQPAASAGGVSARRVG